MKATQALHNLGQSLWLDNITRTLLDDGTIAGYINDLSVTGLTSNPSIFQKAMASGDAYDKDIAAADPAQATEALFIDLALDDLRRAAKLFEPAHHASHGVDGWVSREVSPLLANDSNGSITAAQHIHDLADCANLFVKIPGTPAGVPAIEESIFAGIPINVTLLFSCEQYLASANAYLHGIERRIKAGLDPKVCSVASVFISRWDVAVADKVPADLRNTLGIAEAGRCYRAYRELLDSPRYQAIIKAGGLPQRLLWASTSVKDPNAPDTLYVEALAAPDTINTIPGKTLLAFADHGKLGEPMDASAEAATLMLGKLRDAGIDIAAVAQQLQDEGTHSFDTAWNKLMAGLEAKRKQLTEAQA
ncbi:MAG: transaldolase [Xanthomonadales bacterium]|nr:transaldolase [Xanthomonadales bacterium]